MLTVPRIRRLLRSPMPLLGKELIEQSARRRTYIIRTVYALLLFLAFGVLARGFFEDTGYRMVSMLGSGRIFLKYLVLLQFGGICLFLPGMMSGVITYEKERESLALLMLTDLGLWEILLQKFIGRLIPMFTFILLGLPLVGGFYAFGGIEMGEVVGALFFLALAALQIGAFSLMFSAYCRTTTTAFLVSYVFEALFLVAPVVLDVVSRARGPDRFFAGFLLYFNPGYAYYEAQPGSDSAAVVFVLTLASIAVFLLLARRFLRTRAFVPPKHRLLSLFRRQDAFWKGFNSLVGGVVLIADKTGLPEEDPVRWREVTKTPLGRLNYLLRLMLLIEIPLVLIAIGLIMTEYNAMGHESITMVVYILWAIATLAVVVRGADVVSGERARQTLDVLLTTPISGADIVRQKMSGVWRMVFVLLIPFLTMFSVEGFWSRSFLGGQGSDWGLTYILFSTATMLVYLGMFAWFANWVGMMHRTRTRAVSTALALVVLWNVLPWLLLWMLGGFGVIRFGAGTDWSWAFLASPATIVPILEGWRPWHADRAGFSPAGVILLNLAWHGFLLFTFRSLCILRSDRYLGRATPGPVPATPPVKGKTA